MTQEPDVLPALRTLVDTLGLKPERPAHPVALPW